MNKLFYILAFACVTLGCQEKLDAQKAGTPVKQPEKEFEMYEMSEMAALMEQMYVDNQRLKERIAKGDTLGSFPNHFMRIHEAVMTDESDNDEFFKNEAAKFINAQKLIYQDSLNAKKHFNEAVNSCISCHEVKCGGPIPRIKKLYIK